VHVVGPKAAPRRSCRGGRGARPVAGAPPRATLELTPPTVRIDVFTLFPEYFAGPLGTALLARAAAAGTLDVRLHDPRRFADDPHRSVDDTPFGGGAGMVLRPEPLFAAVEAADPVRPLFLLGPGGRPLDQARARALADGPGFSLLCGRYEGVDERVAEHLCDEELSIGDYVLGGGEAAALVVIEAVARLVPGVVGNDASCRHESFAAGLREEPQYTRPAEFRGWAVPAVLRSGDHARIARWRAAQALRRTLARRPDLLRGRALTPEEQALLEEPDD
jgi:tRNA (guanine37-N1)-methyltransferase